MASRIAETILVLALSTLGAASLGLFVSHPAGELGGIASVSVGAALAIISLVSGGIVAIWRYPFGGKDASPLLVAILAVLAGVMALVWVAFPASTHDGLPTGRTWILMGRGLQAAHGTLARLHAPLPATAGVLVVLAGLAISMGALAQMAASFRERPSVPGGLGALPGIALVAGSAAIDPRRETLAGVAIAISLAAGVLLIAARPRLKAVMVTGAPEPARRGRVRNAGISSSVFLWGLATLAAAGSGGALYAFRAQAVGRPAALAHVTSLALVSSLTTVERRDASAVLFTSTTPATTYWQVAVLDRMRGVGFVAGQHLEDALGGGTSPKTDAAYEPPLSPSGGTGHAGYGGEVTLKGFDGPLLPVPLYATSVAVPGGARILPSGVLAREPLRRGERYRIEAIYPSQSFYSSSSLDDGSAGELFSGPPSSQTTAVPKVSPAVESLTRSITAGAAGPAAKAMALERFFHSGAFRYSLSEQRPPQGTGPLQAFLLLNRDGSCEAYADAFAIMARIAGMPSRVAVGFTAGARSPSGAVVITGADAHAWPEVYLGSPYGWVSFDPTPTSAFGAGSALGVVSTAYTATSQPPVTAAIPPATGVTSPPRTVSPPAGKISSTARATKSRAARASPPQRSLPTAPGGLPWWAWAAIGLCACAALASGGIRFRVARRRRLASRRDDGPPGSVTPPALGHWIDPGSGVDHGAGDLASEILLTYQAAERLVGSLGASRMACEAPHAYVSRLEVQGTSGVSRDILDAMSRLARLAELVAFSNHPISVGDVIAARSSREQVISGLRRHLSRGSMAGGQPSRAGGR